MDAEHRSDFLAWMAKKIVRGDKRPSGRRRDPARMAGWKKLPAGTRPADLFETPGYFTTLGTRAA